MGGGGGGVESIQAWDREGLVLGSGVHKQGLPQLVPQHMSWAWPGAWDHPLPHWLETQRGITLVVPSPFKLPNLLSKGETPTYSAVLFFWESF